MPERSTNITLLVEGMDCSNCALGITKSLEKKGMENVYVDFATGEASFLLKDKNKLPVIIEGIHNLGYKVLESRFSGEEPKGLSRIEKRFYLSLPFTIILFFSHMFFSHDLLINHPYIQLLLCLPVFFIGIIQFGKSALGSLKSGLPNMDVLIFIGSTSAFIYSLAGIWLYGIHGSHNYLFFETTATIITLVLLGNVLEHRSVRQTTGAIRGLAKLQVEKAKMLGLQFGKEVITEVDYKNIQVGAILQVNSGDRIPVDGEIISGEASIDESMLTGEALPAERTAGSKVIGGTILVDGNFRMRAEKVGNDTALSQIIELVKKAQQNKPAIQKLGDKVSAVFVPVVLGISIITFLVSYFAIDISLRDSIMRSVAVLVISCPCAMGLATPTAVMVGIGRAAKKGILVKGGDTLEQLARIRNVVFDKTGTLTSGQFRIKALNVTDASETEVKDILYQLEQHSSHPIAKSIVSELQGTQAGIRFTQITEKKGKGIFATDTDQNTYSVGSYKTAAHLTADSGHAVYVIKNDKLIACPDLEDDIKENARKTISELNGLGIQTILLSGDSRQKCEDLASTLGIKTVHSEKLPEQKSEIISRLVGEAPTAMVGDGINDAPALAKATVGISLSSATQVAIESAQVILLKHNDLSILVEAQLISKHTLITIKQNLFWAFFYNIVAIPIAAMGLLNPMAGALAMAFSDIIVIGNSIRLKTKKLT